MTAHLPRNASSLVAMREMRQVPELPVLVSFVGPLEFNNLTLTAEPAGSYDWRCLTGLEVEVFVSRAMPFADVLRHLAAVAAVVPKRMVLSFSEGPRVECGEMRRVSDEQGDFYLFDWFPIPIWNPNRTPSENANTWAGSKAISDSLWKELGDALPIPFDRAMDLVYEIAVEKQEKCA